MTTLISSHVESAGQPGRPTATEPREPVRRVRVGGPSPELVLHVVCAVLGALALDWLVYEQLSR